MWLMCIELVISTCLFELCIKLTIWWQHARLKQTIMFTFLLLFPICAWILCPFLPGHWIKCTAFEVSMHSSMIIIIPTKSHWAHEYCLPAGYAPKNRVWLSKQQQKPFVFTQLQLHAFYILNLYRYISIYTNLCVLYVIKVIK